LVDRRSFLQDAGAMAASVLVALGASPRRAAAAPMELVSALGGDREDKSYAMPARDGTQIDKDNGTIVARYQGKVYVFSLACPHQNTAIKWYDKDNQFECPKHHSRYLPNGEYVKDSGRATRGLDRFAIRKDGSAVVINLDKLYQEDEDEAPWKAAFVTV
jgi:Rieske Fe-S protein